MNGYERGTGFGNIPGFMQQAYENKMAQMYRPTATDLGMGSTIPYDMSQNSLGPQWVQPIRSIPGVGNVAIPNTGLAKSIHRKRMMNDAMIRAGHPGYKQSLLDLKNLSGELDEPTSALRQYEKLPPSAIGEMIRRKNLELMHSDAADAMNEYSTYLMPYSGSGPMYGGDEGKY